MFPLQAGHRHQKKQLASLYASLSQPSPKVLLAASQLLLAGGRVLLMVLWMGGRVLLTSWVLLVGGRVRFARDRALCTALLSQSLFHGVGLLNLGE